LIRHYEVYYQISGGVDMVMAKVKSQEASVLLNEVFKHFQNWIKQSKDPTLAEVEKFFTQDFQLYSNGLLISKNLSDHLNRIAKLRKKYSRIKIEGPHDEPLVSDNKFATHYTFHLTTHTGQESQIDVMAIVTTEDNKCKRWTQVAHEKGKDWPHQ
jgi:uncharacterized NAD(P)/FAD-binding protein YdhS